MCKTLRVLTNAVRRSFYNLLLAQKTIKVASDNLEHYREILRVNEIRLKVGDVAAVDFIRIEVESLKAQGDQDQARTALNQARADLLLLLGWPENSMEISAVKHGLKRLPKLRWQDRTSWLGAHWNAGRICARQGYASPRPRKC